MRKTINLLRLIFPILLFCISTPASAYITAGFATNAITVNENAGSVSIPLNIQDTPDWRFGQKYTRLSILYLVTGEGFTDPNYQISGGRGLIELTNGITGQSIVFNLNYDPNIAPDRTFTVTLDSCGSEWELDCSLDPTARSVTVTVRDVAPPSSTIGLAAISYSVNEAAGTVTISVNRTGDLSAPVSVDYSTANGTATDGLDYSAVSGQLNWAANDGATKTVSIPIMTDMLKESGETFSVTLSNVSGAGLGANTGATITIADSTQALADIPNLTPNELSVATALDGACNAGATGEFLRLCRDLYTSGNAKQILDAIIPEQIAAQAIAANEFGFLQMQLLRSRMLDLRRVGRKKTVDTAGFNINVNGQPTPLDPLALANSGKGGGAGDDEEVLRDSPLSIFLKGQIDIGRRGATDRAKGFDIETKGITLGADYRFNDELVMGMALGFGYTKNQFAKSQGSLATQSLDISAYGSNFLPKDFYLDWILSYTINQYDTERRVSYPGFLGAATSKPMGDQYGIGVGFGKDMYYENFFFNPYGRLEYLKSSVDGYSETAAGGVALAIENQTVYSAQSALGGQISLAISLPWGVLTPGVRAEWLHQFENDDRPIRARFVDAPIGTGRFAVMTDNPDRDYFNLGASISLALQEGRAAFFRYETRAGHDNVSYHTLELGARMPF